MISWLAACQPQLPCAGGGEASISVVANAGDGMPLADGGELPVFPPPQGGVFSELDVHVRGLPEADVEDIHVRVTEVGAALLADSRPVRFPTLCEDDDSVVAPDLPVGFLDVYEMPEQLDGKQARVDIEVGPAGEIAVSADFTVTIFATDYAAPGS